MDDLVININIDETNQHQNLIVETFLGIVKSFKSKKYSGQLRKTDIVTLKQGEVNLSQENLYHLVEMFNKKNNKKLGGNKYLIHIDNTSMFFSCIKKYAMYYSSQKSSMYRIEKFFSEKSAICIDYANKGYKGVINCNGENKFLTNGTRIVQLKDKKVFLFDNNVAYTGELINATVEKMDGNFMNFIIKNAWNPTVAQIRRYRKTNQGILSSLGLDNDKKLEDVYDVNPIAVLYLNFTETGNVNAVFKFRYLVNEVEYSSAEEYIIFDNKKIYRDKKMEVEYETILLQCHWKKSLNSEFVYQGKQLNEEIEFLLNRNFVVLSEKKTAILSQKSYTYRISYNIDWFQLDANIVIDEKIYSLAEILQKAKKGQHWVEIDNHIVMLPTAIVVKRNLWTIKDKKIRIDKKNIGNVLELAKQLDIQTIDKIKELTNFDIIKLAIPAELLEKLRGYQIDGVKWLLYLYSNQFGGCLADDMGLGKTVQIIAFLSDTKVRENRKPSLIIVPKTLISNWKNELEKFNSKMCVEIYHGINRNLSSLEDNKNVDILLTTYGTVLNDVDKINQFAYNCIILDEAQYIKNSSSKTYRAVSQIGANIKIAMTGTPIENNVADLWALMDLLNKNLWGRKKDFVNRYSAKENLQLLNTKISPFLLRRTKKQVLTDLPSKTESIVYCEMEETQKTLYDTLLFDIKEELEKPAERYQIKINATYILNGLLHLRQVCSHPSLLEVGYNPNHCTKSGKFEVLKNIIEELYVKNEKVVIFSPFTKMLKIIEKWIKQKRYHCFYLDGKTNKRQDLVDKYEKSSEGIFLISLKAGGVGINLTSGCYAVIYDPWWNPAVENQAADRLYRIGQKRNVIIYKLITRDSIEEKVDALKKLKLDISDEVLDEQADIKNLDIKELKNLFYDDSDC